MRIEISSDHKLPASGTLCQIRSATSADELHLLFENYWTPYWLREGDSHPHRWDEALKIVNGMDVFLENVVIPWGSMESWRHILDLTKNGSSAGTDGWRYEELKFAVGSPMAVYDLAIAKRVERCC